MKTEKPSPQIEIQRWLRERWFERRSKNAAYSLRAFAKSLKLQPSALSEILNGHRLITLKMARKVSEQLCLDPQEQSKFLELAQTQRPPNRKKASPRQTLVSRMQLNVDEYRLVSDWQHFAILSLAETESFNSDPETIAKNLGISKAVVVAALSRLERLEMIARDPRGQWTLTGRSFSSPDEVREPALRNAHLQNLELAKNSLERDDIAERDFGSITMAIDPALLPEAKKRIRAFRRELCEFLESGNKKRVYKLCTQIIPLSTDGDKK